ncbi:hypothetical protein [Curtobacterium sp. MEB011]|uniref:hypothetical protein n=1 Tax=Curtobacterium sp. MEB011 TaxID=3040285 RepID=UPI00254AC09E|nr:hypothetical protein [Curtobacterium sp. MEB011]
MSDETPPQSELYARWLKWGAQPERGRSLHDTAAPEPSWDGALHEPWHFEYQPEAKR